MWVHGQLIQSTYYNNAIQIDIPESHLNATLLDLPGLVILVLGHVACCVAATTHGEGIAGRLDPIKGKDR